MRKRKQQSQRKKQENWYQNIFISRFMSLEGNKVKEYLQENSEIIQ